MRRGRRARTAVGSIAVETPAAVKPSGASHAATSATRSAATVESAAGMSHTATSAVRCAAATVESAAGMSHTTTSAVRCAAASAARSATARSGLLGECRGRECGQAHGCAAN